MPKQDVVLNILNNKNINKHMEELANKLILIYLASVHWFVYEN